MKTRFGVILLVLSIASQAYAQYNESPYLIVTLAAPSHPWVNLADCQNATNGISIPLSISWGMTTTPTTTTAVQFYPWLNTDGADVFLSADSTCDVVTIEIGTAATGTYGASGYAASDIEILPYTQEPSGTYPDDTVNPTTLTLQAVLTNSTTPSFTSLAGVSTTNPCPASIEANYYFCIRWQDPSTTYVIGSTTYMEYFGGAPIRFDFNPPAAPVLTDVTPSDGNLKVFWTAPSDDDLAGYVIYHSVSGTDSWSANNLTDPNATNYQITGLENDVAYVIKISAVDTAQNEGASSAIMTAVPVSSDDGDDGDGCSSTTPAPDHPSTSLILLGILLGGAYIGLSCRRSRN